MMKCDKLLSCAGISSRSAVKRSHDSSTKFSSDPNQHPPSKAGHAPKREPLHSSTKTSKSVMKHGSKTIKISSAKPTDMVGVFPFFLLL